jgi:hypothetical protein
VDNEQKITKELCKSRGDLWLMFASLAQQPYKREQNRHTRSPRQHLLGAAGYARQARDRSALSRGHLEQTCPLLGLQRRGGSHVISTLGERDSSLCDPGGVSRVVEAFRPIRVRDFVRRPPHHERLFRCNHQSQRLAKQ